MISYYAPPVGMSGVMRVTKLAKYLPQFDWQPYILTTKPIAYYHYDYELLNDLQNIKIFRSESLDFARILYLLQIPSPAIKVGIGKLSLLTNFILFPDAKIPWVPFAFNLGCKIIDKIAPDIIWATSPPFSTLLIGTFLKQHYHLPLVCDFRDPWPTGFITPPNPHRKRLADLRANIIRQADKITAVNQITAEHIYCRNAVVIENGYDPEDFQKPPYKLSGFSIVYTGMVWENIEELKLVAEAITDIKEAKLVLVGKCDSNTLAKINRYHNVEYYGTRPHSETTAIMKGASLLLYLSKPNQIVGIKLYEYLGARRPVLGVCNQCNEATRLIEHLSVGITVPCVKQEIRQAVLLAQQDKYPFAPLDLGYYNRINQAKKLAEIMANLTC